MTRYLSIYGRPPRHSRLTRLIGCAAALLICSSAAANTPSFDVFDELLLQNVRSGFVNYDGFLADPRFESVVQTVGENSPAVVEGADNGLAFYINAYNALAIRGILNGNSPSSWWGRRKFFKKQEFAVLGERISLETLEHERIVPLGDPRIHFAIVCASMSCPRLASRAYRADDINTQLHDAAVLFINDPVRNRFDVERRIAFVSMIFDWYEDDFATAAGSVQRYLARFVDNAEAQEALRADEFELRFVEYDWNLNGHFSREKD